MKVIVERLNPGQDLLTEILALSKKHSIKAASLASVVGSLSLLTLRFAGAETANTFKGPFEIVSGTGTLGQDSCHIHISVADGRGTVIGGHLQEGNSVYTTVELIIHDYSDEWKFERETCEQTGYLELCASKN